MILWHSRNQTVIKRQIERGHRTVTRLTRCRESRISWQTGTDSTDKGSVRQTYNWQLIPCRSLSLSLSLLELTQLAKKLPSKYSLPCSQEHPKVES
jgi:hypothetical protein